MKSPRIITLVIAALAAAVVIGATPARPPTPQHVFIGTTPCNPAIRPMLGIAADADAEVIEWKLTLRRSPTTNTPSGYQLHCDFGLTLAGHPGVAKAVKQLDRHGSWSIEQGTASDSDAVVIALDQGGPSFASIDSSLLLILNPDRSLMVGNGGWSWTLSREDRAEPHVDHAQMAKAPEMSYRLTPFSTGPTVYGLFVGRTPCQGIARELGIPTHPGIPKAKWVVTLLRDSVTQAPTTYKVEGSLFPGGPLVGTWGITRGTVDDPDAVVYRLARAPDQPALSLLAVGPDVVFFLDRDGHPLVGGAEFAYTLDRKSN